MKIILVKTEFNFSFISVLLYLVFLALLICLGFWQLDRAEEKRRFFAKEQLSEGQSVSQMDLLRAADTEDLRYKKIEITGQYDQQHQYLIDNQIVNRQVGYFVMTPFLLDGMEKAVLVNRGWVALNKQRSVLPELSINTLKASLTGRINAFPVVGIKLAGAEIPTEGWPSVVQVVDVKVLSERLGYSLFPFQIELDSDMENGYIRDWKKTSIMPPEKHIAYAVQWFGLAITLTILFIWMSSKK